MDTRYRRHIPDHPALRMCNRLFGRSRWPWRCCGRRGRRSKGSGQLTDVWNGCGGHHVRLLHPFLLWQVQGFGLYWVFADCRRHYVDLHEHSSFLGGWCCGGHRLYVLGHFQHLQSQENQGLTRRCVLHANSPICILARHDIPILWDLCRRGSVGDWHLDNLQLKEV